jgi:hypothetical protein
MYRYVDQTSPINATSSGVRNPIGTTSTASVPANRDNLNVAFAMLSASTSCNLATASPGWTNQTAASNGGGNPRARCGGYRFSTATGTETVTNTSGANVYHVLDIISINPEP